MATKTNSKNNKIIKGTAKADTITNTGDKVTISGGKGNDYIWNAGAKASISGGAGHDFIVNRGNKVTILGGTGNDTLISDKNDSWGDAVNDTLYGGEGDDVFIYVSGKGKDIIMDYESGYMLTILKSDHSEGGTFTNSSFKSGNLTLEIEGGGSVVFSGVSSGDKFNINDTIYTIKGKKLK